METRLVAILVALSLFFTACSSQSPVTQGDGGAKGQEEACQQWATHYCNRLEACSPLNLQLGYGDVTTCAAREKPVCLSALAAAGTGASATVFETCASAYDSASCDEIEVFRVPQGCSVAGSLPAGAPCGDDSQCTGAYCKIPSGNTCGTCSALVGAGAACDADRDCQHGLVCGGTCIAPVAPGAACDASTHLCPPTLLCFNGTCSPPAEHGAACTPGADNCDGSQGLFCEEQAKICSAFGMATLGGACSNVDLCPSTGWCDTAATKTCLSNAADRAHCDSTFGPFCSSPAACVGGVCTVPDATTCH